MELYTNNTNLNRNFYRLDYHSWFKQLKVCNLPIDYNYS
nr:unnamed protein product [Moritella viscosa]